MIKYSVVLFILFFAAVSCFHQKEQGIADYFDKLHNDKKFNGNVLIVKSGTELYRNSFGLAKGDASEKLTQEHLFQIGSIYKEFPAVAIMQLKEKGLLSLDDKLSQFVPDLPEWAKSVKIKHLLQYSSGLPLIDWPPLCQGDEKVSLELVLKHLPKIQELEFEPGSNYVYSNYNPFLLIRIIESVSKLKFEDYVEQRIFAPHEIEGIQVIHRYPYEETDRRAFARPFNEDHEEDDLEYELPSVCASLDGMHQWFEKLDSFRIVSKESVKQLSEKAKEGDNIQSPLGRGDWENGEFQLHLHHGATGNYECLVRHYNTEGIFVILLTNQKQRNLHEIADEVYEMISKTN